MEVIVTAARIGDTSGMRRFASLGLASPILGVFSVTVVALGGCTEGFEGTVWDDARGTKTLSLYDGGAVWQERTVDTSTGERIVSEGLRFEGVYTDGDEAFEADLRCVGAEGDSLATPCDTKVARKLACALSADDDAELSCALGKETIALHRRGVRRVSP